MKNLISRISPYFIVFIAIGILTRISLLARALVDVDFLFYDTFNLFITGTWFDIVTFSFVIIPVLAYYLFLPKKLHGSKYDIRIDYSIRAITFFLLTFNFVAEHLFWSEFNSRFNFIAVDYLVYTNEVIGNIVESYPLEVILPLILLASGVITYFSVKFFPLKIHESRTGFKSRIGYTLAHLALLFFLYNLSSIDQTKFGNNAEAQEIAGNGLYNLFYSFFNNEINYSKFYKQEKEISAEDNARSLLIEENSTFKKDKGKDLTKVITSGKPELYKNVVLVVMESMSADYMGTFGNQENITPNLDKLAKQGLLFSDTYATGTRTARGLEAVTLSIPPTPGQSIIRRKQNDNLYSLGFVLKDRGYETKFIYGGYGYFDNMNEFFSKNGFDVIDRTDLKKSEITFSNIWGICDEDLFKKVIKEADTSFAKGEKFASLVMTTSNHRPYTYPDNKIDLPSKSGRTGGVKYADYSIGKLIEESKNKPWFKDTIFVFVADHTAGAAGKVELDPAKYHIPMIFYSPGFIKQQEYKKTASQIDVAPILFGLMNFSYNSKFYGEDLLNDPDEIPHAFISNYQKVALVKNKKITILEPKKLVEQLTWPEEDTIFRKDKDLVLDTIAYYQSASWWKKNYRRIDSIVD